MAKRGGPAARWALRYTPKPSCSRSRGLGAATARWNRRDQRAQALTGSQTRSSTCLSVSRGTRAVERSTGLVTRSLDRIPVIYSGNCYTRAPSPAMAGEVEKPTARNRLEKRRLPRDVGGRGRTAGADGISGAGPRRVVAGALPRPPHRGCGRHQRCGPNATSYAFPSRSCSRIAGADGISGAGTAWVDLVAVPKLSHRGCERRLQCGSRPGSRGCERCRTAGANGACSAGSR